MKKTVLTMILGEVLLVSMRKVLKDASNPSLGYKPSIELADFVSGRPVSAVAAMNSEDSRFIQSKPQRAFQPIDLSVAIKEGWITEAEFESLQPSKDIAVEDQIEGKHYKTLNILNPTFNGQKLKVQIIETTKTERKNAESLKKINPATGKVVTSGGLPVYRIAQVAFEGSYENVFLPSDKALVAVSTPKAQASENIN